MIMLYWARWVGSGDCDFGPYCRTVVGSMIGGMKRFMGPYFDPKHKPKEICENPSGSRRDVSIRIAVLQMQREMMLPHADLGDLKQLQGPEEANSEEAA